MSTVLSMKSILPQVSVGRCCFTITYKKAEYFSVISPMLDNVSHFSLSGLHQNVDTLLPDIVQDDASIANVFHDNIQRVIR